MRPWRNERFVYSTPKGVEPETMYLPITMAVSKKESPLERPMPPSSKRTTTIRTSDLPCASYPNLSYVMTRYRQCHDYWHVLTNLPPTVLGELALKWLELLQTGLPLAALSATGGATGVTSGHLSEKEKEVLWSVYFPWAIRVGSEMKESTLMCVYYEEELETELSVLRERMGVEVAPSVEF